MAIPSKSLQVRKVTPSKLAKIRVDYEQAVGSQVAIAEKHKISRVYLWELAKKHGWQYGCDRETALAKFQSLANKRLDSARLDTIEEHALELSKLREELGRINTIKHAKMIESKITSLLKIIEGERLTYGMPSEYKYSEQKTEKTIRFEDVLKTIQARKSEYKVIEDNAPEGEEMR